jgi:hypothetical protein
MRLLYLVRVLFVSEDNHYLKQESNNNLKEQKNA